MSWRKITLIALFLVAMAQVAVFAFLLLFDLLRDEPPAVAVFDPEKSLTMFVVWSNGRVPDEQFGDTLPAFQQAVQLEIDRLSGQTGQIVVRKGAVLSAAGLQAADVTGIIMEKVLSDAAF
ncbi:TrbI F-type domain-containing protein [Leisingera aquimarina]|uniref:TrbI F-type domain-containing protein n=1 Tax=Leisingera aquimarina TaxID=476529 RepID=UPI0004196188|nr:TrbI F-type domain-containing protein [Leisingera aquimarina]